MAEAFQVRGTHPHYKLAQTMPPIQIAIPLSSITPLTRKQGLFAVAAVSVAALRA